MKIAFAVAGFLGLTMSHALAQATEVRVGTSGTANTVLALWMAEDAGLYTAQNLKVTISNMGGGSRGAAEVRAGKLDVMHVGLSSVVQLNQKGADLRTIASLANVIRFAFFAVPGVKTAAELKGGTVAVSAFGSESDAVATIALARLKLTRKDVELKEFGDSLKRLEALKAGEIKATMLNEPFATAARGDKFNVLVDLAAEKIPWLFSTLVVSREISEGESRDDGAVPQGHRRRQLPRARRPRAREAGAGEGHARLRSQDRRDHLCRLHADDAARPVGAAPRARRTSCRTSRKT